MTETVMAEARELLTMKEVAEMLRCDYATVRRWVQCGALEAIELPASHTKRRYYRIERSTIEQIMNTKSLPQET